MTKLAWLWLRDPHRDGRFAFVFQNRRLCSLVDSAWIDFTHGLDYSPARFDFCTKMSYVDSPLPRASDDDPNGSTPSEFKVVLLGDAGVGPLLELQPHLPGVRVFQRRWYGLHKHTRDVPQLYFNHVHIKP